MLNKAYVRGVNDALRAAGIVKFANDELANGAADLVAEQGLPEEAPEEIPPETTAELASNLSDLAQALQESADSAAQAADAAGGGAADMGAADMGAAGMDPASMMGAAGPAAEEAKAASVKNAAAWLRQKLSATDTGSTITGTKTEQENKIDDSANAEAEMDQQNRPGGKAYANQGVAGVGTQEASGKGAVGTEEERKEKMGPVAEDKSNSVTDAIKSASIIQLLKKLAEGTTIDGKSPDQQNTLTDAAGVTGEGKMEAEKRPHDYANLGVAGVGESEMAEAMRQAAVGTETPHPGQEDHGGTDSNTIIDQSSKTSAEREYLKNFQAVANKYASYLPPRLSQVEKVSAVKYLMSQEPVMRDRIAMHMSKTAEMPAGLAAYMAKEKGEGEGKAHEEGEGKDEKKEKEEKGEDKDGEKKSSASSVLSRIRQLVR